MALTTAGLLACGRSRSPDGAGALGITLYMTKGPRAERFVVSGLTRAELDTVRGVTWPADTWERLFTITVAGADTTPVAGRYVVTRRAIEFHPAFPLDLGRAYTARFDPSRLPVPRAGDVVTTTLAMPAKPPTPPTTVVRILPSADTLPENLLRLYVEFSAPMSLGGGIGFITLLDADGRVVRDAFLPLDADFWNREHTRYTLFLDPGRVKRGILPNEQMGRALRAGRVYSIAINAKWRDAEGQPLAAPYRRTFHVGPSDDAPIAPGAWHFSPPRADTRDPLVVTFPEPLDHGLLLRALGVETDRAAAIDGDIVIGGDEREWRFTPRTAWRGGAYHLLILSILEDLAGNRVGRPFEVDMFERVDRNTSPDRLTLPFTVR